MSLAVGFFKLFNSAADFFFIEGTDFKTLFEDLYLVLSFFDSSLDNFDSVDHSSAAVFFFNWFRFWCNLRSGCGDNSFPRSDNSFPRNDNNFIRYDYSFIRYDDVFFDGFDFFFVDLDLFFEFFNFFFNFNWIDLGVFFNEFLKFLNTFFDSSDLYLLLFNDDFRVFFNDFLF